MQLYKVATLRIHYNMISYNLSESLVIVPVQTFWNNYHTKNYLKSKYYDVHCITAGLQQLRQSVICTCPAVEDGRKFKFL